MNTQITTASTHAAKAPLLALLMLLASCKGSCTPPPPRDAGPTPGPAAPSRLRITNGCPEVIWIQQQNMPANVPSVIELQPLAHADYDIPAAGLASTRYWPKKECNDAGQGCAMGQSSAPCTGCAPPVDSKLEVTWGCTLADKKDCGKTPQGVPMIDTWWNASAVDGFTLPFSVGIVGGDQRSSCLPVDCSDLMLSQCPTDDDLSDNGKHLPYAIQDERVRSSPDAGVAGCFSPCMKLGYPGWGGDGLNDPGGSVERLYCCPGPMADECRAGPVVGTKYVKTAHAACHGTAYAYAYDDGIGGRNCSGDVQLQLTFCPPRPAAP
jgi:hypothetical protein